MIQTKAELAYYIDEDLKAYGKTKPRTIRQKIVNWLFPDAHVNYMITLRRLEYWTNCKKKGGGKASLLKLYYHRRLAYWRRCSGIELNINCAGPGLHISHGKVVVSAIAKLGAHCKLLSDVTIGGQGRYDVPGAPILGDRVFVASGAKIIGPVRIANDVVIGANSVVIKDILEPGITVAGIPARKISDTGSYHYLNREK